MLGPPNITTVWEIDMEENIHWTLGVCARKQAGLESGL